MPVGWIKGPAMKDDAAISPERLLIQPAVIGGGTAPQRSSVSKDPFVSPGRRGICGFVFAYFRNSLHTPTRTHDA
jgi:hypothetical protein